MMYILYHTVHFSDFLFPTHHEDTRPPGTVVRDEDAQARSSSGVFGRCSASRHDLKVLQTDTTMNLCCITSLSSFPTLVPVTGMLEGETASWMIVLIGDPDQKVRKLSALI